MTVSFGPQLDFEIPPATLAFEVQYLEHVAIHPDPDQPRTDADAELVESIRVNGIVQPITVRRHPERLTDWMIVDGERRWRGAAGLLERVPAIVREDLDDRALRLTTQLVANVGKPLSPLQEARSYQELMTQHDSIASLARAVGRPASTVAERLELLELGPWLVWIEEGRLPVSHAVKVLLPLRGVASAVHAHLMEVIAKDPRWEENQHPGGPAAITLRAFEALVHTAVRPYLYPLTKTKTSYAKQPEFDTRAHDQECDCGRIQFALESPAKRACCGNPDWWRPKARAARKAAPKKPLTPSGRSSVPTFQLPQGAGRLTLKGFDDAKEKEVAYLTGYRGTWEVRDFDPTTLEVAPEQLVLVEAKHFAGARVATRDKSTVALARAAWRKRWLDRRDGIIEALRRQLKDKAAEYRVSGPGVAELLAQLPSGEATISLADVARAHEVELPKALQELPEHRHSSCDVTKLIGGLSEAEAAKLATGVAYLLATRTKAPSLKVLEEREKAKRAIEAKPVPWAKREKGKGAAKAAAVRENVDEDAEDDDA